MNEEHLADILSEHLDKLLAGQPLLTELPAEVAELLPLAQNLAASVPAPRPDFGPALKSRLLQQPPPGANGSGGSAGPTSGGSLPFIGAAGFLVIAGGIVLVGLLWLGLLQSPGSAESLPTTLPSSPTPARPAQPAALPASTPAGPRVTGAAADSLVPPAVSPTAILDVLPPLTATVESAQEIHLPIDLVPGESSSSDSGDAGANGAGKGGSGGSGDHNRGHGNDDDHDDDDNPGHD